MSCNTLVGIVKPRPFNTSRWRNKYEFLHSYGYSILHTKCIRGRVTKALVCPPLTLRRRLVSPLRYISSGACGCPSKMMKGVIPSLLFLATFFASSPSYKEEKASQKNTFNCSMIQGNKYCNGKFRMFIQFFRWPEPIYMHVGYVFESRFLVGTN